MYNITLRHICATTVAVEKQKVSYILSACVCNVSYLACKVYVVYYIVICGLSGFTTVFHTIS